METRNKIRITAFPRIHLTLIGMNSSGYRVNGGIGFSIKDPTITTEYTISDEFEILDTRNHSLATHEIARLRKSIANVKKQLSMPYAYRMVISGDSLTHYGLGTSTALYMSATEALFVVNGFDYNEQLIQKLSSRGRTSGIGINTYFRGGIVFDLGVKASQDMELLPSSASSSRRGIPLCARQFPAPNWDLGLLFNLNIGNKSESEEMEFFQSVCPIEHKEVEKTLYHVVFGVLASLLEEDYPTFCQAVNNLQETKWKLSERGLYGESLSKFEKQLKNYDVDCLGMSSLGPGLFYFAQDPVFFDYSEDINPVHIRTAFNNSARIIEYA